MTDIYVHLRMKECCRNTLKDLDERKKKAPFRSGLLATTSLHNKFGNKPLDEAHKDLLTNETDVGGNPHEGELERLTRTTCEKICQKHAEKHEQLSDTMEGQFWRDMSLAVTGHLTNV